MITQTVEYALRAIVTIAQQGGEPCTVQKISELARAPSPYLSKLMQRLVRAGLVQSQRGLHGGFVLAKDPHGLTMLEIVNAVDPIERIEHCPLGIASHGTNLCPLHRRLDDAMAAAERIFRETTVAEMLANDEAPTPLCAEQIKSREH